MNKQTESSSNQSFAIEVKMFISILIANILTHYDVVLYALMGNIFAKVFFVDDGISSLITTYTAPLISIFLKPLGASLFGAIAINFGPANSLFISLLGITISTLIISFIPSYQEIGLAAPILLVAAYSLQVIFNVGEATISSLYIAENTKPSRRCLTGSIYGASSILGVALASSVVAYICNHFNEFEAWRFAYYGAFFTGIINVILRLQFKKQNQQQLQANKTHHFDWRKYFALITAYLFIGGILTYLIINYEPLVEWILLTCPLLILLAALIFYKLNANATAMLKMMLINAYNFLNFVVPFILFNSLVPLMNNRFDAKTMMEMNAYMSLLDAALLPIFGWLSDYVNMRKTMLASALLMAIVIFPAFFLIPQAQTYTQIVIIRAVIVVLGVGFSAPSYKYYLETYNEYNKYLVTGVSIAIGGELTRRLSIPLAFTIWKKTGSGTYIALYIAILSLATASLLAYEIYNANKTKN